MKNVTQTSGAFKACERDILVKLLRTLCGGTRKARVSPRERNLTGLLRCLAFTVIFVKKKVSRMSFLSFLVVFLLINQSIALETGIGEDDTPFRMNRLNMIWKKAQNKMSEQKLSDFRRLLELQDRAEIRWKELKAKGGDEDGEMEAMIRQKFARIMEQFGLEKHLDATDRDVNEINDNKARNGMFGDRRLSELWESVEKQGLCLLVPLIRWAKGFSLKIISNFFAKICLKK